MGPRHAAFLATVQMVTMAISSTGLMIAGAAALKMVGAYGCKYSGAATCPNQQVGAGCVWQLAGWRGLMLMIQLLCG